MWDKLPITPQPNILASKLDSPRTSPLAWHGILADS
jgi:hypothetical protein